MLDWYVTTRASPGNVFRLCICHWRWVLGIPFEAHFFPTQIFIYSTPTSFAYRHSHGALLVQNTLCSYSTYSRCVCTYASLDGWPYIIMCSWLEWFTHSSLLEFCAHSVSSTNWNYSGKWKSRLLHSYLLRSSNGEGTCIVVYYAEMPSVLNKAKSNRNLHGIP